MQKDDMMGLTGKASALVYRLEQQCHASGQQLQAASQELSTVKQELPGVLWQAANDMLKTLSPQIVAQVQRGLEPPTATYEQRMDAVTHRLQSGSERLVSQMEDLRRLHRSLIWKIAGTTVGSLALLLVGGLWLSMHYTRVIRDNQIAADIMNAYNAADVQLCDGRLCANVEVKGKRYGSKGEYLPVRAR